MTVKITVTDKNVSVESPYNPQFVTQAKQLGGKWGNRVWNFDIRDEERVRELCRQVYGTDGTPVPTVTLRVEVLKALRHTDFGPGWATLTVGGVNALSKHDRDRAPSLGTGCVIVAGELYNRGGSRNNPQITCAEGTIVEVRDVPQALAERLVTDHPDICQIVTEEAPADELTPAEKSLVETLRALAPDRLALVLAELGS